MGEETAEEISSSDEEDEFQHHCSQTNVRPSQTVMKETFLNTNLKVSLRNKLAEMAELRRKSCHDPRGHFMVLTVLPTGYIKKLAGYGELVLFNRMRERKPSLFIKNAEGADGASSRRQRACYYHTSEIAFHTIMDPVHLSKREMYKVLWLLKKKGMTLRSECYITSEAGSVGQQPHFDFAHYKIKTYKKYLTDDEASGYQAEAAFNYAYQKQHGFDSEEMSYSILYALMDDTKLNIYSYEQNESGEWVKGETIEVTLNAGQMLIFDRTVLHAGANYDAFNVRIFAYYEHKSDKHVQNGFQWFLMKEIKAMLAAAKVGMVEGSDEETGSEDESEEDDE